MIPVPQSVSLRTRPVTGAAANADEMAWRWSRAEKVWVVGLVAMVAIPGAWHLGRASLWNDEAATWAISGHSFSGLLHVLRTSGGDRGAALYYLVVFAWIRIFGSSEAALRALSLVAASATMIPFHACARRLVTTSAAWAAGAVLATSAFFLTQARDARTYSLAVLMVVLAVWTFQRALDRPSVRNWTIFTVVGIVSVYVHWFSAFVLLGLFVALLLTPPPAEVRRPALTSALACAAATVPIAALVLAGASSGVDWIAPLNLTEVRTTIAQFTGTSSPALQLIVAIPLVVGLVNCWNSRRVRTPPIILLWFATPILLTIAVSIVKPVFVARYLIIALPAFAVVVGLGLSILGRRRVIPVAVLTLALVLLCYGNVWSSAAEGENWRAVVATVGAHAHGDDAVVVYPATAVSAFAYYARDDASLGRRIGPTWPPTHWETTFTRSIANSTVAHHHGFAPARTVWLVVRQPRGEAISRSIRAAPALAALRDQLGARFSTKTVIGPWRPSRILSVVRYSSPIRP